MTDPPREVDYVVVGAGTAGCLITARLANAGYSVALIEAGPNSRDPAVSVPIMTGYLLRSSRHNWSFKSEPVPALRGRRIDWPRGKLVGGSGAINGMVYARGLASDYDRWAQIGLTDWSWDKVRPVFEDLEAPTDQGEPTDHIAVDLPNWWTPLYDAFLNASQTAGLGLTDDFNGPAHTGAGRYRFTTYRGRRAHTARTYLKPALATGRVALVPDSTVLGIDFVGRRAVGLRMQRGGAQHVVKCRSEIILSAGTVGSPHLLMLSGIGPGNVLPA
ncbi:MAG: GMC family oxidoreductase N-terminal domain-containing protein, partial [Pseudomonadota bacterium]